MVEKTYKLRYSHLERREKGNYVNKPVGAAGEQYG